MNATVKEKTSGEKLREEFIELLEELFQKNDRAALATLRRGLGKSPGEEIGIYRYLGRFANRIGERREAAYHLVATLFGLYPGLSWSGSNGKEKTNLGASFKHLQAKMGGDGVERRFTALLNAHSEVLPEHLRQVISLLKSQDIPIDWVQLLRAVEFWDVDEDRRTQRAWAKAFWKE